MEKKQTAVEWLEQRFFDRLGRFTKEDIEQAKQMEKEQKKLELPSDEQIDDEATNYIENASAYSFVMGAKWMRDKIKGGNNE
jgi:predicted transcriptional regulator